MPQTKQITVYKFAELTDAAKERARTWYRKDLEFSTDTLMEQLQTVAECLGWKIRTHVSRTNRGRTTTRPKIQWSGFGSQGDGLCFDADFYAATVDADKLKSLFPDDSRLLAIAEFFGKFKMQNPQCTASVEQRGRYCHENATVFEVDDVPKDGDRLELMAQTRDIMRWAYAELEEEYEYQNADAQIDEALEIFEFTADGSIFTEATAASREQSKQCDTQ